MTETAAALEQFVANATGFKLPETIELSPGSYA
jgi:hypothetical protein